MSRISPPLSRGSFACLKIEILSTIHHYKCWWGPSADHFWNSLIFDPLIFDPFDPCWKVCVYSILIFEHHYSYCSGWKTSHVAQDLHILYIIYTFLEFLSPQITSLFVQLSGKWTILVMSSVKSAWQEKNSSLLPRMTGQDFKWGGLLHKPVKET